MTTASKRFVENLFTLLILYLLLVIFTDASSQVLSVIAGFFGGKMIADILASHLQDTKEEREERKRNKSEKQTHPSTNNEIKSTVKGKVIKVCVTPGTNVRKGDVLLIVDSCKMEMEILAPFDGLIQEVLVTEGDTLVGGEVLVRFY